MAEQWRYWNIHARYPTNTINTQKNLITKLTISTRLLRLSSSGGTPFCDTMGPWQVKQMCNALAIFPITLIAPFRKPFKMALTAKSLHTICIGKTETQLYNNEKFGNGHYYTSIFNPRATLATGQIPNKLVMNYCLNDWDHLCSCISKTSPPLSMTLAPSLRYLVPDPLSPSFRRQHRRQLRKLHCNRKGRDGWNPKWTNCTSWQQW